MRQCPKCHKQFSDELNYCTTCGTPLATIEENLQKTNLWTKLYLWLKRGVILSVVFLVCYGSFLYYCWNSATYLQLECDSIEFSMNGMPIPQPQESWSKEIGIANDAVKPKGLGLFLFEYYVNQGYRIKYSGRWFSAFDYDQYVKVRCRRNDTGADRIDSVVVQSGDKHAVLKVLQHGSPTFLRAEHETIELLYNDTTELAYPIYTDTDIDNIHIHTFPRFCDEVYISEGGVRDNVKYLNIKLKLNDTGNKRECPIEIRSKNFTCMVKVIQWNDFNSAD